MSDYLDREIAELEKKLAELKQIKRAAMDLLVELCGDVQTLTESAEIWDRVEKFLRQQGRIK